MKFIKSNLAKKLIIVLIALMVFNIAVPHAVNAGILSQARDIAGGLLFKPLFQPILRVIIEIDIFIGTTLTGVSAGLDAIGAISEWCSGNSDEAAWSAHTAISKIFIGPDTIFSGNVTMLNANIFEAKKISEQEKTEKNAFINALKNLTATGTDSSNLQPGLEIVNTARTAIARVYYMLRNICGFVMLAGLIFTGIKILLSSNIPARKTEYLKMLQDWLIGMVLLIFSHIIMVGIFFVSDSLVKALSVGTGTFGGLNIHLVWNCYWSAKASEQIILLIILGYLIWLTIVFAISYFKRFMWICVLTVFAPVCSIMYAFGQQTKQTYSRWLKEYMLTVFVQPFHMIVYSVLVMIPVNAVGGGWNLDNNLLKMVYALIAISFIRPAEKYMRDLFGMGQGVASMASYDSGKQTFDAVKNTIEDVVKKVEQVALTVANAGAGAAAMGAAGAASSTATSAATNTATSAATNAATQSPKLLETGMNKSLVPDKFMRGADLDADLEANPRSLDTLTAEERSDWDYYRTHSTKEGLWDGKEDAIEENIENNNKISDKKAEEIDKENDADKKRHHEEQLKAIESREGKSLENINASNVTITAGAVNMQGEIDGKGIKTIEEAKDEEQQGQKEKKEDSQENKSDDGIGIQDGEGSKWERLRRCY